MKLILNIKLLLKKLKFKIKLINNKVLKMKIYIFKIYKIRIIIFLAKNKIKNNISLKKFFNNKYLSKDNF